MSNAVKLCLLALTATVVGVLSLAALAYAIYEGFDITFENVDPTAFNTFSAFLSVASTFGFGFAMSHAYNQFLSWDLRRGNPLPISVLGIVPGNAAASASMAYAMKWTLPALMVMLLFLCADLAHTLADLGLEFVTIQTAGPKDTVLNLTSRNTARLLETAGDPLSQATTTLPRPIDDKGSVNTSALPALRKQNAVIDDFLLAVELIARGRSPFIPEGGNITRWNAVEELQDPFETTFMDFKYGENNTFVTEVALEIPLNCEGPEMVEIEQTYTQSSCLGGLPLSTALVPNCTLNAERATGIFGEQPKTASILESAYHIILPVGFGGDTYTFLTNDTAKFQRFDATPEMRTLARDRNDWKRGRAVPGIDGVRIGMMDIAFGSVIMAAGKINTDFKVGLGSDGLEVSADLKSKYGLVAEVVGECPPRPSGLSTLGTRCLVLLELDCPIFPEDAGIECGLEESFTGGFECSAAANVLNVVWGNGFEVDNDLVAVVAGLYGRIQPEYSQGFLQNAFFAAMFATASLDVRTSTAELVRPRINAIFIAFKLIPFFLISIVLLAFVFCSRFSPEMPVPRNAWQLLVLGREEHQILPGMEENKTIYPMPDTTMVLTLHDDKSGTSQPKICLRNSNSDLDSPQTGSIEGGAESQSQNDDEESESDNEYEA